MNGRRLTSFSVVIWFASVTPSTGDVCTVPSAAYPTIAAAVANPSCTEIVLQASVYQESVAVDRSLSITGISSAATTIVGQVVVDGAATVVSLNGLKVDAADSAAAGCFAQGVNVVGGARVTGVDIVVTNATGFACHVFGDDFESGTTGGWSATVP